MDSRLQANIRRTGYALLGGFLAIALVLGYWQVWRAPELAVAAANPRVAEARLFAPRGRILDRTGELLARSEETPQGMRRLYTQSSLVHAIGFHSLRFGDTNLEARYDAILRGTRTPDPLERLRAEITGQVSPPAPTDLVLTIDQRIQQAAVAAMGDARGAIVALDPRSGAVLALVSTPFFDPNASDEELAALQQNQTQPLFNRAVQARYTPGSTFKAVTAVAAIDRGLVDLEEPFSCTQPVRIGDYPVDCRNSQHLPRLTFEQAFAWSTNRVFALAGLLLGFQGPMNPWLSDSPPGRYPWQQSGIGESATRLKQSAARFGFDNEIPFDLDVTPSTLKRPESEWTPELLAQTAFGQGELQATPLQMALVAAAIANDGRVPTPYLVEHLRTESGRTTAPPARIGGRDTLSHAMSEQTARTMVEFMVEGVERGYAEQAAIQGVEVGGKTGTAEVGGDENHSWFIGFAPADDPRVAVAVIGERQGSGSEFATVAARRVMQVALEVYLRE